MEEYRSKYRLDKRAKRITRTVPAAIAAVAAVLLLPSFGDYLPAWFFSIALAVIALCILSIPRRIAVTQRALEIRCVIEITHIPYGHIKELHRVEWTDLKPFVPVFASAGFFGYFGYYLDIGNWEIIKVYASSRQGLVMIEDIYEQRYLVNAEDPGELCRAIENRIKENAEKEAAGPNIRSVTAGG